MFQKAIKRDARGRVALIGPAGSGKSATGLIIARRLAGPTGKIAAIDTERGSLSKYADVFDFDVAELASFTPENFLRAIKAAEASGYDAFVADSLSHFWEAEGGALDFVEEKKKGIKARGGDHMDAWKGWREHERNMINAMTSSSMHVIVTMRTKTEFRDEQYQDKSGNTRTRRIKVGLQPIQRQGLEYEFDLVGYMDEDNTFVVDKTRVLGADMTSPYAGRAFTRPTAATFDAYADWLKGQAAAPAAIDRPWKTKGEMAQLFAAQAARVDGGEYNRLLVRYGVIDPKEFQRPELAVAAYSELTAMPARQTASVGVAA